MKKKILTLEQAKQKVMVMIEEGADSKQIMKEVDKMNFDPEHSDEFYEFLLENDVVIDEDEESTVEDDDVLLEDSEELDEIDDFDLEIGEGLDGFMGEYVLNTGHKGMSSKKLLEDPMKRILNSVKDFPILSPDKQIELAKVIQEERVKRDELVAQKRKEHEDKVAAKEARIAEYERKFAETGVLDPEFFNDPIVSEVIEDFDESIVPVEQRYRHAEHVLTLSNQRLILSLSGKYKNKNILREDLVQEGTIGLLRAIEKFDHKKGFRFSTYATWWIRQAMTRYISDNSRTIRVPVHMGEQITKIRKIREKLNQTLGRVPNFEEIAIEMINSTYQKNEGRNAKPEEIKKLIDEEIERIKEVDVYSLESASLSAEVNDDGDATLADFIESEEAKKGQDEIRINELREVLRTELASVLSDREIEVIFARYGIGYLRPLTLEEIGEKIGVTRERIRQIQAKAIEKIKDDENLKRVLVDFKK